MLPRIVGIVLASLLLAAEGAAQARGGALVGTVRAAGPGGPLGAALVTLLGTPFQALSDAGGAFRLDGVPPGRYTLRVRTLGHHPQEVPVEVSATAVTRLDIELRMQPIALEPVRVEARRARGRTASVMRGFYERMESGRGHYLTREDIEARRPRTLAEALEMVPGIRVIPRQTPFGTEYEVQTGRNVFAGGGAGAASYECPVAYFLDGMPFRPASIGSATEIRPGDIEGIEVYTGPASIPPQFNQARAGAACGVIVIWTRAGP